MQTLKTKWPIFCKCKHTFDGKKIDLNSVYNLLHLCQSIRCQIKEGATTYRLINEYFRLVAAQKPTVLIQIVSQVQKNCNGQQSLEEYMEIAAESDEFDQLEQYGLISSAIEKLNCIITAITEALLYTEFEKPWANLVEDIQKYIENIRNCKQKPNYLEEAKYVSIVHASKNDDYIFKWFFFRSIEIDALSVNHQRPIGSSSISLTVWET